jgi:hypothetical protein
MCSVRHWAVSWDICVQSATEPCPETYVYSPPLNRVLRHVYSPPLNRVLRHMCTVRYWTVSWDTCVQSANEPCPETRVQSATEPCPETCVQSTTEPCPETQVYSPPLNRVLKHMCTVRYWTVSWNTCVQSATEPCPETHVYSPPMNSVLRHVYSPSLNRVLRHMCTVHARTHTHITICSYYLFWRSIVIRQRPLKMLLDERDQRTNKWPLSLMMMMLMLLMFLIFILESFKNIPTYWFFLDTSTNVLLNKL